MYIIQFILDGRFLPLYRWMSPSFGRKTINGEAVNGIESFRLKKVQIFESEKRKEDFTVLRRLNACRFPSLP